MNIDQLEDLAGRAGLYTDLMRMGAASLVYSPGCQGVTVGDLERFASLVAGQQGEARPAREDVQRLAEEAKAHALAAVRLPRDPGPQAFHMDATNERIDRLAALATQAAPEAPPLSSAAPDNNAPAPMALSSEAQAEPAGEPVDTDFEVTAESEDDAEWCAGASGPNALAEAMHYARQYRQDYGPEYTIVVRSFTKREVARIDAALADGGAK